MAGDQRRGAGTSSNAAAARNATRIPGNRSVDRAVRPAVPPAPASRASSAHRNARRGRDRGEVPSRPRPRLGQWEAGPPRRDERQRRIAGQRRQAGDLFRGQQHQPLVRAKIERYDAPHRLRITRASAMARQAQRRTAPRPISRRPGVRKPPGGQCGSARIDAGCPPSLMFGPACFRIPPTIWKYLQIVIEIITDINEVASLD